MGSLVQSLVLSIEIVFPNIAIMMLGWFLRRVGLLSEKFIKDGTWFSFNIACPMSIYMSLQGQELGAILNVGLTVYMVLGLVAVFFLLLLTVPRFVPERPKAVTMAHNMLRANFVVQGIPMLSKTYGAENIAVGAATLPFMVVANNVLGTLLYVILIPSKESGSALVNALKKLLKNPLILASVAGIVVAATPITVPPLLLDPVEQVSRIGTPLLLLCLGAEIDFGSFRRNLRYTVSIALVRLVLIPAVLTAVGMLLGFRGIELGTIFLFNASCTVVAGYVMAAAMGGDTAIAAESLGLTAIFSAVSVTAGLTVLLHFGLI